MDIAPTLTRPEANAWRPGLPGLTDWDLLSFYHAAIPTLRPNAVVVEIGTWRHRSLLYAASVLAGLGRKHARIYGVDPYRYPPLGGDPQCAWSTYREALACLVGFGTEEELHHVHLLRCTSDRAARLMVPGSLDLVVIDGDHSESGCLQDIGCWAGLIRRGGLIAGHDYDKNSPGVMAAVDQVYGRDTIRLHGTVWWHQL